MIPPKDSFFAETSSFINNHKLLCGLTLGLAIVVYAIGNLGGRAVSWIKECGGTAKKADGFGKETFNKEVIINEVIPKKSDILTRDSTHSTTSVNPKTISAPSFVIQEEIPVELSPTAKKLLAAYNSPKEGWVMVPPSDQLKVEQAFVVGSGAIGFEGNGRWKIHVSIDPAQMEQAIPIIVDVLHSVDAPRLGFKMQTKANLDSVHQIGKELAIIFDKQVEEDALKGDLEGVQNCLNLLWKKLNSAGIRPEPGFVLTPQTITDIRKAPNGSQVKEKQNLETGKFDRAISCPEGRNFFYYRDENFAPMRDDEIGDLRGIPGVYAASDIIDLALKQPNLAHNPTQSPDPFLNLKIQGFNL
jgi:hypothetical protein